ncbi:MAG: sigma-54 dependent transcriptional regulator [Pseudomonadota bacterium]
MSDPIKVLIVDDDEMFMRVVSRRLRSTGYLVVTSTEPQAALQLAREHKVDVALLDVHMPGLNGFEVLQQLKQQLPAIEVIMMTGMAGMDSVLQAMRLGAFDYLPKPFARFDEVCSAIERAARQGQDRADDVATAVDDADLPSTLLGRSAIMQRLHVLIRKVAQSDAPVLIVGESGTGKELIACEIHRLSRRQRHPWIPVNCAALPENLQESELFGYVKGAFTGAVYDKRGLFVAAHQGTMFLDEVGDLALPTQTKLLRVLQERQVRPIGATGEVPVDFRLLCATNIDLEQAIADKRFRDDLYYRIKVVRVDVPPLRERREDIPELANHFLAQYAASEGKQGLSLSPSAMTQLQQQPFKGNVRELQNTIYRAVVLADQQEIQPADLDLDGTGMASAVRVVTDSDLYTMPFTEAKRMASDSFEREYVERALTQADGKISAAARLAQLDRSNFKRIIKRHQLDTVTTDDAGEGDES